MLIGGAHPHGPPKPGPDEHEHSRSTYIYLEDQAQHDHLDIKQKEINPQKNHVNNTPSE